MCKWPSKFCNIQEDVCTVVLEKDIFFLFVLYPSVVAEGVLAGVLNSAPLEQSWSLSQEINTVTVIISQADEKGMSSDTISPPQITLKKILILLLITAP